MELLLILEFEWALYTKLLPPLVVGRLFVKCFPCVPDQSVVYSLVVQEGATRGLFSVQDVELEEQ